MFAGIQQRFQRIGHESFFSVASVVRHHDHSVADLFEFIFEDHQILRFESDDSMDDGSLFVEFLGDGVCDRTANAAADDSDFLKPFRMGRHAQRTHKILQRIAFLFQVQQFGRCSDDLENDGDRSLRSIKIGYGQRNSFSFFVDA